MRAPFFLKVAVLLLLTLFPDDLFAQQAPAQTPPADATEAAKNVREMALPLTPADKKFIKEAGEGLYYELAIAELALRRNRPVGVGRDATYLLASKIHPEVQKAHEELAAFAKAKNERMRDELSGVEKRDVEELRAVNIEKFHKGVVSALAKASKSLAQTFAAPGVQHPVLKKLAETHAPKIKAHVTEIAQAAK
jgi:hypothetical protein